MFVQCLFCQGAEAARKSVLFCFSSSKTNLSEILVFFEPAELLSCLLHCSGAVVLNLFRLGPFFKMTLMLRPIRTDVNNLEVMS